MSYPPPPPGGYPAPPPDNNADDAGPYSVGKSFSWGWKKYQENVGTIIVAALIYIVVLGVLEGIFFVISGGFGNDRNYVVYLLFGALFSAVFFVVASIMQAGILRGALELTNGRKPEVEQMVSTEYLRQVLVASLAVGILAGIGFLLCIIPGFIVIFYAQFTMFFVVERGLGAFEALRASFALVGRNVSTLLGFFFASFAAYLAGAIVCGIGLLIAIPLIILAQAYTYRRLQGQEVSP